MSNIESVNIIGSSLLTNTKALRPLTFMELEAINSLSTALVVGIGIIGPSLAIGMLVAKALEAIGRNPEASAKIQTSMLIGIAFAEALAIFAIVIGFIIKFG